MVPSSGDIDCSVAGWPDETLSCALEVDCSRAGGAGRVCAVDSGEDEGCVLRVGLVVTNSDDISDSIASIFKAVARAACASRLRGTGRVTVLLLLERVVLGGCFAREESLSVGLLD